MISELRRRVCRGQDKNWTLSQRGGGTYRDVTILNVSEVGICIEHAKAIRCVPWTSINEVSHDQTA